MLINLNVAPLKPKRVIVLGGQGFVGRHIVDLLKKEEINVLPFSREQMNLLGKDATAELLKCLEPTDALVVISALAPCKNNAMLLDNITMVKAVADAIEKTPLAQVIYISSDAVYADDANPVTEDSPKEPSSLHGMMHSARELMLKAVIGKTPFAILRSSLLYGVDDPHNGYGPNRFRRLALEGKPITLFGEGEEKRDHVFIEDLAKIVSLCLTNLSQGTLNIATGESLSFRETAEIIVKLVDEKIPIQGTPRQNAVTHRHFNIAACRKVFPKFHYTTFRTGIENIIQTLREQTNG